MDTFCPPIIQSVYSAAGLEALHRADGANGGHSMCGLPLTLRVYCAIKKKKKSQFLNLR